MSGDVSLAADVNFPDSAGYGDRKAVLVIRQTLEDNSREAMVALHGGGLIHLAYRPQKGADLKEMRVPEKSALRIGIEKHGDAFSIYVSMHGEPMHKVGHDVNLHIRGPFYVGIGFCSHQPIIPDTAILSNLVLVNAAGKL
ncbi:MAG: biopolymer transporter Tol [Bacteroidota bacterium]|nr:biopolymer transporter Tol [Bacteroidota bacterium]